MKKVEIFTVDDSNGISRHDRKLAIKYCLIRKK